MPLRVRICGAWLIVVAGAAILADLLPLSPRDADACQPSCGRIRPFQMWSEVLGTDAFGRSILTRLIYGARVSIAAALGAVLIALAVGLVLGIAAGYFRGKVDGLISLVLDSVLSFPGLVLLITLAAVLQPSVTTVIVGLAILSFPAFARLARAGTLQHASSEFVMAARGLGAKRRTILFREILPVVLGSLTSYAGVVTAMLVLAEASLSFLGLGVPPPQPSWGSMIAEGRNSLQTDPHLIVVPALVLSLTIFAMNTLGDWLRGRNELASKL